MIGYKEYLSISFISPVLQLNQSKTLA